MEEVKGGLATQFKMKDLGELHYCLGILIEQSQESKCLWLHQKQYISSMLERYRLSDAKPATTPADINVKLRRDDKVSRPVIQQSTNQWWEAYSMSQLLRVQILPMHGSGV